MANAGAQANTQDGENSSSVNTARHPHPLVSSGLQSQPFGNLLINHMTTIKMDQSNFFLWKNLALPILRGCRLEGHITGTKPCPPKYIPNADDVAATTEGSVSDIMPGMKLNPEYESWVSTDQLLIAWFYNSMAPDVAIHVLDAQTSKELWNAVQVLFGLGSKATANYYRCLLYQTRKGSLKMEEYLKTMKCYSDNLALTGSPISLEDLISLVLAGLDEEYIPVVVSLQKQVGLPWIKLKFELLLFEKIHDLTAQFTGQSYGGGQGHGNNGGSCNNSRGRRYNHNSKPTCQICGKLGHTALSCFFRFDNQYMGSSPNQASNSNSNYIASPESVADPSWY